MAVKIKPKKDKVITGKGTKSASKADIEAKSKAVENAIGVTADSGKTYSASSAEGKVSVEHKHGSDQGVMKEEVVPVDAPEPMEGPLANVGFKAGITKNLGNFNSARVDVSLFLPCPVTQDAINATFEFAKNWVDETMEATVDSLDWE